MALKIGVLGQKGGAGKSTLSRLLAVEYARSEWNVLIADFDPLQSTSTKWNERRLKNGHAPVVDVTPFNSIERVLRIDDSYDLIIFDSAPHATQKTMEIAGTVDLIVIPTGMTLDDLNPSIALANDLKRHGVTRDKIVFVLNHVGSSSAELSEAYETITDVGYICIGDLPERTAYHRALDMGQSLTETPYETLNQKAGALAEAIHDKMRVDTEAV